MAHVSGNPTWTNTGATPINAAALENLESSGDYATPVLKSQWKPIDQGLLGWTYDPILAIADVGLGTASMFYAALWLGQTASVTGVVLQVTNTGAATTAGGNWAGLYDSGGALIGTSADQTTSWQSAGTKTIPFTGGAKTCQPGLYKVAALGTLSTGAVRLAAVSGFAQAMYLGPAQSSPINWRSSFIGNIGTTTLPSQQLPPSNGLNGMWAAIY